MPKWVKKALKWARRNVMSGGKRLRNTASPKIASEAPKQLAKSILLDKEEWALFLERGEIVLTYIDEGQNLEPGDITQVFIQDGGEIVGGVVEQIGFARLDTLLEQAGESETMDGDRFTDCDGNKAKKDTLIKIVHLKLETSSTSYKP